MKKSPDTRPVNLNLTTIRFPVTAIASIFHRLSGLWLFLTLPFLLFLLQHSLASEQTFAEVKVWLGAPLCRFAWWLTLVATMYHMLAGIRHLLMDSLGWFEEKQSARCAAWAVLLLTLAGAASLGMWLW